MQRLPAAGACTASVRGRVVTVHPHEAALAAARARVRGLVRVAQDFKVLAAAVNLARFAALGLRSTASGWQVQPA